MNLDILLDKIIGENPADKENNTPNVNAIIPITERHKRVLDRNGLNADSLNVANVALSVLVSPVTITKKRKANTFVDGGVLMTSDQMREALFQKELNKKEKQEAMKLRAAEKAKKKEAQDAKREEELKKKSEKYEKKKKKTEKTRTNQLNKKIKNLQLNLLILVQLLQTSSMEN